MSKALNIKGLLFGKLLAEEKLGSNKNGKAIWLCTCSCGKTINALASSLVSGNTKSCGCVRGSHKKTKHKYYSIWSGMISRCKKENRHTKRRYFDRGIKVCKEWKNINNFIKWVEQSNYKEGLMLDRIDNDKGYSPRNCTFVTPKENSRNRKSSKKWYIKGVLFETAEEAANFYNVDKATIRRWVKTRLGCITILRYQ